MARRMRLPLRHRHLLFLSTPLLLGALLGCQHFLQNHLCPTLPVSLGCFQFFAGLKLGQTTTSPPGQSRGLKGPGLGPVEPG
jgi:hypothetical protein